MLHFQTDDFFKTKTCGKQEEFTLLHVNEEFEFRPSAPLNWSHGENSTQKEERIEEETECDTLSASD
jgi:hypothetical protein